MEKLVTAKHWQIFIIMMTMMILSNFKVENQEIITSILSVVGGAFLFIYLLSVVYYLQDYLPERVNLNYNLFLINNCIWIIAYSFIMIISEGKGMTFKGIAALPGFYVIYAFLHSFVFTAKTLKSIELRQEASFGDYIGDFFLLVFLPIGIWFLQPRINRIVERKTVFEK